MSKTEPEKADTVKGIPENETPAKEQGAAVKVAQATEKPSIPKMNVETSVPTKDPVSKEQQEVKSQPLSFSGQGHIPTSGDIVVPFEKIKEMAAKKEPVKEVEQNGSRDKKTADKAGPKTESTQQDKEKPLQEAKQQTKPKTSRTKAAETVDKQPSQPAIVRPREEGGYEIVSGHRRQKDSELAELVDMPCLIRNLTDEQAITQ